MTDTLDKLVLYEGWPVMGSSGAAADEIGVLLDTYLSGGDLDRLLQTFIREVVQLNDEQVSYFRSLPGWWESRLGGGSYDPACLAREQKAVTSMSESVAEQVPGLTPVTITAFAGLVLMVGINLAAVKVTVEELAPMWSAGLRFAAAALILGAVVLVGRHPLPRGRALVGTLLFGFLSFAAFFAFVYLGIQRLPVGVAALLFASVPLMTFAAAVLHRLEAFRWLTLAGGLLTLGGIAVMTGGTGNGSISVVGVGAMLAAAGCAAEAAIIAKRFPPVPPLVMNAIGMSIGALILLALSFASREAHSAPREITTLLSLAYLILVGSIATFITYLFVLRRWTASGTSYMFVLAPVVAVVFASLFQGERITFRLVAGGTLVIAGVYVGALLHIGKAKVSERRTELAPTAAAAQAAHSELSNFPADCIRCP